MATPYSTIERSGEPSTDRARVADVVAEVGAELVVVGLPLSMDGSVSANRALTAAGVTGRRRRAARAAGAVDQATAIIVLQSWLDRCQGGRR